MALDFAGGVPANMTRESIALFAKNMMADRDFRKAITTATGPQAYDLEPEVKSLFPVNTPLRNSIPRYFSKARGDVQTHWQAITSINTGNMPLPVNEGRRAGAVASLFVNRTARYATLGLEDSVTEEARLSAQGYDDIDARTVQNLIWATMIGEEIAYLGGNNSWPLGTTNTPTLSAIGAISGQAASSLTSAQTVYVKVAALTLEGYNRALRNGGTPVAQISRTVVGSTLSAGPVSETLPGGVAQISAEPSGQAVGSNGNYINATCAVMAGAVAYAWYAGTAAGAEFLYGISTINSIQIGSVPTTGQAASSLPASDNSAYNNAPVGIDGIIPVVMQGNLGGGFTQLPTGTIGTGTNLSLSGTTITQIDAALLAMWNANQIGPDTIWVNAQQMADISNKIFTTGGANQIRFAMDVANQQSMKARQFEVAAGVSVGSYLNRFGIGGPSLIEIRIHPNVPPGTIVMTTRQLPYPNSNVTDIMRVRGQLDYHQIAWGPFTRSAEYGVYLRCTLQIFFPPAFYCITNVGTGA